MPLTRLTCPICLSVLKPKTAVHEGARIRCPKCKGSFIAEAEPKAPPPPPVAEPILAETQEPMPEPVAAAEVMEEIIEAQLEEIVEEPPRVRPRASRDDDYDRPRRRESRRGDEYAGESRLPRRRKKGGIPLWVWLVSGGAGLFLLLGCCGVGGIVAWHMWGGMSVNMDNYNKITRNMTEDQVVAIMGAPTDAGSFGGIRTDVWKSGDNVITITFLNGKIAAKNCHLQSGAGTVERTDMLGP